MAPYAQESEDRLARRISYAHILGGNDGTAGFQLSKTFEAITVPSFMTAFAQPETYIDPSFDPFRKPDPFETLREKKPLKDTPGTLSGGPIPKPDNIDSSFDPFRKPDPFQTLREKKPLKDTPGTLSGGPVPKPDNIDSSFDPFRKPDPFQTLREPKPLRR